MSSIVRRSIGNQSTFTLVPTGLATANGCYSNQVDFTSQGASGWSPAAIVVHFLFSVSSAVAPNAGTTVQFYWARGDDNATLHLDGNIASAMSTTAPSGFTWAQARDQFQFCYSQNLIGTANVSYRGSFMIWDPGPRGSLIIYNDSGQNLFTGAAGFYFRYSEINTDIT
jgi:hypothetical protein